ncbi:50S ribosomal protein L29 [Kroppenstedtia pulmonis]|uniref:50S ribosomal protein L29 n=1 Tax=Kroppenstedtia pulmonis TaxID=1380685 RepID=A0A7D4CWM8_9BACL|nr:50S ribosomal protein L29 [Kroppenstedtia pulmonis]QKG85137.1 50S ribosomal protein L29 [Kroppenstedtia pulmonis]
MNNETFLGLSARDRAFLYIVPPILGAVLGWFLPSIADWALTLPWAPFQGVLELITSFRGPWVATITAILGLIAGYAFAHYVITESLGIYISNEQVKLVFKEKEDIIAKKDISAVYVEDKQLILLGTGGSELYREQHESKKKMIQDAFKRHHYPWENEDPFQDAYHLWVTDDPALSPNVNALLQTRAQALEEEEKDDAKVLRKELAKLGVVIRDEGKWQYIRMSKKSDEI